MAGKKNKLIDLALIERIINDNDQLAYVSLMDKYKKAVYFTVLKMVNNSDDADDITMQTFTKAFKNIKQYNSDFAFSTWLFRIASNTSIDHIRKKRIVTTSLDNQYDADEQSISRMANAILAAQRKGITDIQWSLADTPTGVMTDVTLADLEEAHELAVENMASIWSVE